MFEHKGIHKCMWHQDTLSHKSVVNFIIVSTDLQTYVHDTRVNKGAELLTDHHLMVG